MKNPTFSTCVFFLSSTILPLGGTRFLLGGSFCGIENQLLAMQVGRKGGWEPHNRDPDVGFRLVWRP